MPILPPKYAVNLASLAYSLQDAGPLFELELGRELEKHFAFDLRNGLRMSTSKGILSCRRIYSLQSSFPLVQYPLSAVFMPPVSWKIDQLEL